MNGSDIIQGNRGTEYGLLVQFLLGSFACMQLLVSDR